MEDQGEFTMQKHLPPFALHGPPVKLARCKSNNEVGEPCRKYTWRSLMSSNSVDQPHLPTSLADCYVYLCLVGFLLVNVGFFTNPMDPKTSNSSRALCN